MAELKDSGARREFGTGAVRDVAEGKGRCDLLPLGVIGYMTKDDVPTYIESYIRHGDPRDLWLAIEAFCEYRGWDIYTAILECSIQYEDGARKYDERNWENGIYLHVYVDSGPRHYFKWKRGDKDEPHDRAFIWNMLGAIWTHENKPELIDLPFANKDKPETGIPATRKPTQAECEELFKPEIIDPNKNAHIEPVKAVWKPDSYVGGGVPNDFND